MGTRMTSTTVTAARMTCVLSLALPALGAADGNQFSDWIDPVHLGPIVNSSARELGPELSPDGHSRYFASDRPGSVGLDMWVSQRACRHCPWNAPVHLGPNINSPQSDGGPTFSPDGHLLSITSDRVDVGAQGGDDIWVSHRKNKRDDFGWGPPVNLGPDVNTTLHETGPAFLSGRGKRGHHILYFGRGATLDEFDIYQAAVTRHGKPLEPGVPVAELNHPTALDGLGDVRAGGRELIFWSTRPGGLGLADIWVATRPNIHHPWSTPQNLGVPVNTSFGELGPRLSSRGGILFFSATAARGSLGFQDIWMSTRTRLDHDHDDDDQYGDCDAD